MAFSAVQSFGVTMFPTDYAIQPVALAKAVEERGLDSLFFPEHTHIPTSRATPFPGGGDLPKMYWHCLLYTSPSPRDVEESRMPSSA